MNFIKWLAIAILVAAAVFAASTYKQTTGTHLSDVEQVEIRSRDWLAAMINKDWEATYEFTSPGYKSGVSLVDHSLKMAARRVSWIGGEIMNTQCAGEVCSAQIRIVYKVFSPLRGLREFESFEMITTNWIKQGNNWWIVPS